MPTVVVVGGADHRVLFSTQSFSTSDTAIMRDSILQLLNPSASNTDFSNEVKTFTIFPNPASTSITLQLELNALSNISIDVLDIVGKKVLSVLEESQIGMFSKQL